MGNMPIAWLNRSSSADMADEKKLLRGETGSRDADMMKHR